MRRTLILFAGLVAFSMLAQPAFAGSPHFVGSPTYSTSGNTVTVNAKEAGLGGESIDVTLSGTAECINPGSHHPKAANKTGLSPPETMPLPNDHATSMI